MTPYEMHNMVYEWVKFSKFPKFEPILLQQHKIHSESLSCNSSENYGPLLYSYASYIAMAYNMFLKLPNVVEKSHHCIITRKVANFNIDPLGPLSREITKWQKFYAEMGLAREPLHFAGKVTSTSPAIEKSSATNIS